jgi:hypothetical protein
MKNPRTSLRLRVLLLLLLFGISIPSMQTFAQAVSLPFSHSFYEQFNKEVYKKSLKYHTSIKPYRIDARLKPLLDSIYQQGDKGKVSWGGRKLHQEHLVEVEKDDFSFYLDFLPDFQIGKNFSGDKRTTWLNTRGLQAGLSIGDKFSAYFNFFENQGVFASYIDDYVFQEAIMPGQGHGKTSFKDRQIKDWMYTTALLTYDANEYLQISLGYDKHFIGDGYRSMLLSDASSNYTALKLTGTIGNVKYMSMWSYMLDPRHPRSPDYATRGGDNWKWGAFQYLDWQVIPRWHVGVFQSVVWGDRNASGKRGFDFNYFNPVIVLRPVEVTNTSSPDKIHIGFNSSYKFNDQYVGYGQFLLGEFVASEFFSSKGHVTNKWGMQWGLRGHDVLGVKNLNGLIEYNAARPYTYTHFDPRSNYTNYGQSLAHPWGANFREVVAIANYAMKDFQIRVQGTWGGFGTDLDSTQNYGKDLFKSYMLPAKEYGNFIGQGIDNQLWMGDVRVSYLLNRKNNLRVELGAFYRSLERPQYSQVHRTAQITLGLRSSIRNLYYDF